MKRIGKSLKAMRSVWGEIAAGAIICTLFPTVLTLQASYVLAAVALGGAAGSTLLVDGGRRRAIRAASTRVGTLAAVLFIASLALVAIWPQRTGVLISKTTAVDGVST